MGSHRSNVNSPSADLAEKCLITLSALANIFSLISGLWLAVNRYESFRKTARVTLLKRKELAERTREEKSEIARLECQYRRKDWLSLLLFRLQVWTFAVGALGFVIAETVDLWTPH